MFLFGGEKLLRKEDVRSPFPNNDEPSDHLPLNATLRFSAEPVALVNALSLAIPNLYRGFI